MTTEPAYDLDWLLARMGEQGLLGGSGLDAAIPPGPETPASYALRIWAAHSLGNSGVALAASLISMRMLLGENPTGKEILDLAEEVLGHIGETTRALRGWKSGEDPALPELAPVAATTERDDLTADGEEPVWLPIRVTDLLHVEGRQGHRGGFCPACANIYAAVSQALCEVVEPPVAGEAPPADSLATEDG